jgi:hypothetical protein
MSEKHTPAKAKTEGHASSGDKKEEKSNFMNTQNILAILLIISLLGNAYLFMQLSACTSQGGGISTTTTTTRMPVIGNPSAVGDLVQVDYVGKLSNGTLFDTSIKSEAEKAGFSVSKTFEPLSLILGDGMTLPLFESGLIGMKAGETKTITIPPGQGYTTGTYANQTMIFTVTMINVTPKDSIPTVSIVVINDARCTECVQSASSLMGQLEQQVFPYPGMKLKVTDYDYNSAAGKKIYTDSGLDLLPAILFTNDVKNTEGYSIIKPYLNQTGQYLSLRWAGAIWDPAAEICDNNIDDDANGQIDCKDDGCKDKLVCRKDIKNNLQVFIMSDCPYGKEAVKALYEVVGNMGKELTYEVHYIANQDSQGGFSSLHGTYESDEDMIQLCVKKHSPDAWLSYINCRSLEGIKGKDWKNCANSSKVNVTAVQACFSGTEGKTLLGEDIKIAEALNIGASPTWLANNRYQFSGIDAETVKTNICKYNANLTGCSKNLSSGSNVSGSCG